jgi:citrate synthase
LIKVDSYNQLMTGEDLLTAEDAARRLGVSRRTLYAYVSRGLVSSEPGPGPTRARRYPAAAIDALLAERERRTNRGLAAHGSLYWGLPVIDSALTLIDDGHLYYRGRDAIDLAQETSFEAVAWLLWDEAGAPPPPPPIPRAAAAGPDNPVARLCAYLTTQAERSVLTVRSLADAGLRRAVQTLAELFAALGADGDGPLAERLARGWAVPETARDIDAALILCADHELNISAFTARCAASADARLEYVLLAALCAFSGGRHGGATERVEGLLGEVRRVGAARAVERAVSSGRLPGFGHPLYPEGDPRGAELIRRARQRGPLGDDLEELLGVVADQLSMAPNLDAGLVVLAQTCNLPADAASALFALGRSAGWMAHALETARDDRLIRPRARYVGPMPSRGAPDPQISSQS